MQQKPHHLIVGRDRAHVRGLLAWHPHQEVVSASQFFDKVRLLAFIHHYDLVRDDYAPIIFAQRLLHSHKLYPLRFAKNFSSLYNACFHGVARPREVLNALSAEHEKYQVIFSLLKDIDLLMEKHKLLSGVKSLYLAREILQQKIMLPPHLATVQKITFHHLVDLTMLEIEVVKELSRLGLLFELRFPLDFAKRNINAAVAFTASRFEQDAECVNIELTFEKMAGGESLADLIEHLFTEQKITLSPQAISINCAPTLKEEADAISQKILLQKAKNETARIAVVMRTMDARAEIFKNSLMRHGLSVRDRKGISLIKTNAGTLFLTLMSLRLSGQNKIDLVGLIGHPLFRENISDVETRSRLLKLMRDLGIDNRIIPHHQSLAHYKSRIDRFCKLSSSALQKNDLDIMLKWQSKIDELLAGFFDHAVLKEYLSASIKLIDDAMIAEDKSVIACKTALNNIAKSAALVTDDLRLTLHEFINWLKTEMSSLTMPRPDNQDVHAVDFLLLPEMLGQNNFDHVYIADMAFGRLPEVTAPDALLDDHDRAMLNRIMKKPLLRVFFDDPFLPMPTPPRQALEPFWFAHAIAAAKASVHFGTATCDETDIEQAPSEYFTWLLNHVSITNDKTAQLSKYKSLQHKRFIDGKIDRQKNHKNPFVHALLARKRGFLEQNASEHFFKVDKETIDHSFAGRLGENVSRALSPTMIEAFSECRLRGFLLRVLNWEKEAKDADDIDARAIGQIAHIVLEKYFANIKFKSLDSLDTMHDNLRLIIGAVMKEFTAKTYVGNTEVLVCHQEWLFDALMTLILRITEERREILCREVDMGVSGSKFPPLSLRTNEREYLVGGRIDRIDQIEDNFLIIDYKLSASDNLRAQLSTKTLLKTNFQAPIYLRLVAKNLAHDDRRRVAFAFASIRDGQVLPELFYDHNQELYERIFNDDAKESLAQEIDAIFAPVIRGEIPARHGEHCRHCDFQFFCRKAEVKHGC